MLGKLFSIEYSNTHKIVYVFGLKLKIRDSLAKKMTLFEASLEQIQYLINGCCDITKCKPADGTLREVQILRKDVLLLVIKILEKHNLDYWLDYGTLLGAFRHKGYIPWDDDIDIAMPRNAYNKAKEILKKELNPLGYQVDIGGYGRSFLMRITDIDSSFYYVDIFPYDYTNSNISDKNEFCKKLISISKKFFKKYNDKDFRKGKLNFEEKVEEIPTNCTQLSINVSKDGENLFRGIETCSKVDKQSLHKKSNIYPLKDIQFEDFCAKAPNNIIEYLQECDEGNYGDIMKFPSLSAICTHAVYKNLNDCEYISMIKEKREKIEKILKGIK